MKIENLNRTENVMLAVMMELSRMEAPIVFKGAMTLKVATGGITRTNVSRSTQDIDGDWVSPAPEMEDIEKILQRAVHNVNPNWTIQPFREFGEKRSAGFKVVDETGMARFHIDMSVRQNPYSKVYVVTNEETGTVCLQGASIEKMLADKISTISTQRVFSALKRPHRLVYSIEMHKI